MSALANDALQARDEIQLTDFGWNRGEVPKRLLLAPVFRRSPRPLIESLGRQKTALDWGLVVYDDGSADADLVAELTGVLARLDWPARLMVNPRNRGRSFARNRLLQEALGARADHFLLVDSDMRFDDPGALAAYEKLLRPEKMVLFGGFVAPEEPAPAELRLHHYLTSASECRPAAERRRNPVMSLTTANVLISRDIAIHAAFSEEFRQWGWEDTDWAIRCAQIAPIEHADIPATHLGLEPTETLLRRFESSAANFQAMARRFPQLAGRMRLARLAGLLRALGMARLAKDWAGAVVRAERVDLRLRGLAARIYRSACLALAPP